MGATEDDDRRRFAAAGSALESPGGAPLVRDYEAVPEIAVARSSLRSIDLRQALTIALVYFATFFVCVCLLPSITPLRRALRVDPTEALRAEA